jgi:predicted dehydrogenase
VTLKQERKIRLFQADTYVSVDYSRRHVQVCRRTLVDGQPAIDVEEKDLDAGDALLDEIEHFVAMVRSRQTPLVDGRVALRALEVAEWIRSRMLSA